MNVRELKEMLQLMAEHGLSELELEKEGMRIRLKKGTAGQVAAGELIDSHNRAIPIPMQMERGAATDHGSEASQKEQANQALVRSPMVGTFYAAPTPDQPPYATVGKEVKEGDVLCIIEAMKLMNEIKCEYNGTVAEILVNNGQAVEFDQPIFKIQKR